MLFYQDSFIIIREDVKKEELPKDAPLVEEVGIKLTEIEVKSEKVQTDGKDASTPESEEMKKQVGNCIFVMVLLRVEKPGCLKLYSSSLDHFIV